VEIDLLGLLKTALRGSCPLASQLNILEADNAALKEDVLCVYVCDASGICSNAKEIHMTISTRKGHCFR